MSLVQYSTATLDYFYHVSHVGILSTNEGAYHVCNTSPSAGAELHLFAEITQGEIRRLCFHCRGGVVAIACCEWICTKLENCRLEQGKKLSTQQCLSELAIPSQHRHVVHWVLAAAQQLCHQAHQ